MEDYKPAVIDHDTRTRLRAAVRKAKSPGEALAIAQEITAMHPDVTHVALELDGVHVKTCDTTYIYALRK